MFKKKLTVKSERQTKVTGKRQIDGTPIIPPRTPTTPKYTMGSSMPYQESRLVKKVVKRGLKKASKKKTIVVMKKRKKRKGKKKKIA